MNETMLDILRRRALADPGEVLYTVLADDAAPQVLTARALHDRAMALAARLRRQAVAGDRVLLMLPTSVEYVVAFFGVLAAGLVAVPLFPPGSRRHQDRALAIVGDCQPRIALLAPDDSPAAAAARAGLLARGVACLEVGDDTRVDDDAGVAPCGDAHVALLQYTSGSTGRPKGVMVTHANLVHNALACATAGEQRAGEVFVSWLPLFHDLGLMLGMLQPLYGGGHGVLMPAASFMLRPYRWLRAISDYRAAWSCAPNFAFDQCLARIGDAECASLDLRPWRMACNGAEPVRAATVRAFTERFARCGFDASALVPVYGMAEATVGIASSRTGAAARIFEVDRTALEQESLLAAGSGRSLVSCGQPLAGLELAIVHPGRRERLGPRAVGEIWVRGPSIAAGYWNNAQATGERFAATLAGEPTRHWLRTGDAGAWIEGELVIAGRLDDVLLLRGRNVFPQDVEQAAVTAHPALADGGAAVFALDPAGDHAAGVVVVAEVAREADFDHVLRCVCAAVIEECECTPAQVVLIRRGTLPRTSSGKVQRRPTRAQLADGSLRVLALWRAPVGASAVDAPAVADASTRSELELLAWIAARLAETSGLPAAGIDLGAPFAQYAVDSLRLAALAGPLGQFAGRAVPTSAWWNHPTPRALARFLAGASDPAPQDSIRTHTARNDNDAQAIIACASRLPGAADTEALWPLLAGGRAAIGLPPAQRPGSALLPLRRAAGYLDAIDRFDARAFGISPLEAQYMDPQQRLVLELAHEALARAGEAPEQLRGSRTGVFVGVSTSDYARLLAAHGVHHRFSGTGSAGSVIANRLSYLLDLRGPSLAIDTACSSSLVALHLARQSLRTGECDLAIVAGVNLLLDPGTFEVLESAGMTSPSHRCHAFDAQADGYVRGEGCVVVLLRREADARERGDPVLARLLGSAVGQDGRTNGLTAPSGLAQQAVIRAAWQDAGVPVAAAGYLEAHGTGTPLGDPIEVEALRAVFDGAGEDTPCWIGSIKAAVGHLEAAAGLAGVAKVLAMFEHGGVPAQPEFGTLNPHIDLAGSRLRVATALVPGDEAQVRFAGVSSFGFGGTSAHVVLESASSAPRRAVTRPSLPLPTWRAERHWAPELLRARARPLLSAAQAQACCVPPGRAELAAVHAARRVLDDRALHHAESALRALGGDAAAIDVQALAATLPERGRVLLAWCADDLVRGDRLLRDADALRWNTAPRDHASLRGDSPWRDLIDRCGAALPAVLRGTQDPLAILFGSEAATPRSLYRDAPEARLVNEQLARLVRTIVRLRPGRSLRVLEVGAGTGAAAALLLPLLPPGSRYVFTDVSRHFLNAARAEFGADHPALETAILDIERPAHEQGIEDRFDLVIASNVLHVGRDPRQVLRNVAGLLADDGLALVAEVTRSQPWFDVSFGMLLAGSARPRAGERPLRSAPQWERLAREADLVATAVWPADPQDGDDLGQHVMVWRHAAALDDEAAPAAGEDAPSAIHADITATQDLAWRVDWNDVAVPTPGVDSSRCKIIADADDPLAAALRAHGAASADPDSAARDLILLVPCANNGAAAVLDFARLLRERSLAAPVRGWIVTRGAWTADGSEGRTAAAAMAWGLARALSAEHPALFGGVLDLDPAATCEDQAQAVARWQAADLPQARWHAGRFEAPRLRSAQPADFAALPATTRPEACYLVTGGWGALGQMAMRYLVQRGARRIVLAGRQAPPSRSRWNDLATDDPWRARIEAVREAERSGASVHWRRADLSDADAVPALLASLADDEPPLAGVIHAAGGAQPMPLERLDPQQLRAATAVKNEGARALAAHAADWDFLLLCGSMTGQLGAGGLGAYAAANLALDAIAEGAAHRGAKVRSIQWGVLGGGLVDGLLPALRARGYLALGEADVLRGLDLALVARAPTLMVARMDWTLLAAGLRDPRQEPLVRALLAREAPASPVLPAPAAAAPQAPAELTLDRILDVLRRELDDATLNADDDIFSRGADSIMCIDIAVRLQKETGAAIAPDDLFAAPTARRMFAKFAQGSHAAPALVAQAPAPAYRLSSSQLRLWFLDQVNPGHAFYNVPAALRIDGPLDVAAMRRTFDLIVRRHAVLRSHFVAGPDGAPVQQVDQAAACASHFVDLSALPLQEAEREALRLARAEARQPFDLTRDPLLRVHVLRLAPGHHVMLVTMHHIASDGWSIGVLSREVAALYGPLAAGREPTLPPLALQYADYAAWQHGHVETPAVQRQLAFWEEALDSAPVLLDLPLDRARPPVQSYRGARVPLVLDAPLTTALAELGRQANATPFVVLSTALGVLFAAYGGQREVCIGTPVANRNRPEVQDLIGFFVNNLVIRMRLGPGEPVLRSIERVRDFAFQAYANQDVPFERVIERLNPVRSLAHAPLFQVYFILHHAPVADLRPLGLDIATLPVDQGIARFDLTVELTEADGRTEGWIEYALDLFEHATIERMAIHLRELLRAMTRDPQVPLGRLDFLPAGERAASLDAGLPIAIARPGVDCAHRLFEEWAARAPERTALVYEGRCCTYGELDARATELARQLRSAGVGAESVVAVCQSFGPALVVSALAILKAGACYLPLDPAHPAERLAAIAADARPMLVLASREWMAHLAGVGCQVRDVAAVLREVDAALASAPAPRPRDWPSPQPRQAAYLVYTSGSTGRPKGVLGEHLCLANRLQWMADAWPQFAGWRFVQKTVTGFIDSLTEMLAPLSCGATLCIASDAVAADPAALARLIRDERVQGIVLVPSLLRELLRPPGGAQLLQGLRIVVSSGEAMPAELAAQVHAALPQCTLLDCYGSSEVGDASAHACAAADQARGSVALGPAIANTRLYVLGSSLEPLPLGAQGEVCVGGQAVGRAYWRLPGMTAERFVPDPYAGQPGARLFRTGDIGRRLADGGIEFLGRRDHQVKLRGFRIELGEVEAVLRAESPHDLAVAMLREDRPGDRRLVGYVAAAGDAAAGDPPGERALKERLARLLPAYMVPAHIVRLPRMPMTPNGKIDRQALPKPALEQDAFEPPRPGVEATLAAIWQEVLQVERVGRGDSFFELGGHSLLAAQALGRARQAFDVDLPMRAVFAAPRLADIAAWVERARTEPRAVASARPGAGIQAGGPPTGGGASLGLAEIARMAEEELDD